MPKEENKEDGMGFENKEMMRLDTEKDEKKKPKSKKTDELWASPKVAPDTGVSSDFKSKFFFIL